MDMWWSISGIAVLAVMILLAIVLWKVTKLLLVPIQILLFLLLVFIVYRLFFSAEKIDAISNGAGKEALQGLVHRASDSAVRFVKQKAAEKLTGGANGAGGDADGAAPAPAGTGSAAGDAAGVPTSEAPQAVPEKAGSAAPMTGVEESARK